MVHRHVGSLSVARWLCVWLLHFSFRALGPPWLRQASQKALVSVTLYIQSLHTISGRLRVFRRRREPGKSSAPPHERIRTIQTQSSLLPGGLTPFESLTSPCRTAVRGRSVVPGENNVGFSRAQLCSRYGQVANTVPRVTRKESGLTKATWGYAAASDSISCAKR